jgi:hypothetical protein
MKRIDFSHIKAPTLQKEIVMQELNKYPETECQKKHHIDAF